MNSFQKALSFFFPQVCLLCGNPVNPNKTPQINTIALCTSCATFLSTFCIAKIHRWKQNSGNFCRSCGKQLISERDICIQCRQKSWQFDQHFSLFPYNGHVKELIFQYKFKKRDVLVPYIAGLYAECIKTMFPDHLCLPVPGKPGKPFKHMEKITDFLKSRYSNNVDYVLNRSAGAEQKTLDLQGRTKSIHGKYSLKKSSKSKLKRFSKILILDDVFTTGSTINECAKMLKSRGNKEINALTFAKD